MDQYTIDALKNCVGPKGWVDPENASDFIQDLTQPGAIPILVVRPATTEEVAAVLQICNAEGIAVVTQGGNTNVCRMAVPLEGQRAVLLSLSRMKQVLNVDPACSTITMEAGCLMQTAQDAAMEQGRVFAPDWGARGTATVGGAVSTNGGGLNVIRYGTTREQVLGLEVVLPDGQIWNGLRALRKDNSGYDLKQMFIGSEGTLGIITRLVCKLHPHQPVSRSMMVVPTDMSRLMDILALAQNIGGDKLTAFELMPGFGVDLALERYPDLQRPLETDADWFLLVRYSGAKSIEDELMQLFQAAFEANLIEDGVLAQSGAQELNLWEIREQMIPGQYFDRPWLKWDVSVPINKMAEFLEKAPPIISQIDNSAVVHMAGHVGDGNIHLSVFPEAQDADSLEAVKSRLYPPVDELIWGMGGSIVAEHGVGSVFAERLRGQKSPLEYQMMQRIKQSFDPKGIMNPGKLLIEMEG